MSSSSSSPASGVTETEPEAANHEAEEEKLEPLAHQPTHTKEVWKFRMRPDDDDDPRDWWFASTAIPLLAATIGPLANVMSIAALVTNWRNDYNPDYPGVDEYSAGYKDPKWALALNAVSLVCGFVGNIYLMFNFTQRIRYIVALPMTIILWYFATGILIGILVAMNEYVPPVGPSQTYSQGFWHAVIAAVLYLLASMMLMINMLGYFLGHYPQHFDLTDEQRNLILQTMMFFIWLAGGAGVYSNVIGWQYVDALYFCDVTILTIGFGDFYPINDKGRGLIFPYSVGGIIILGLMVGSIRRFAQEIGHDKFIKGHVERRRVATIGRSVTTDSEFEEKQATKAKIARDAYRGGNQKSASGMNERSLTFKVGNEEDPRASQKEFGKPSRRLTFGNRVKALRHGRARQPKLLLLREERDRFNAMRRIQKGTKKFKSYYALTMSVMASGILWCIGAVVFWKAEQASQGMTYFQALYFCYVSLLTIGYGDLSPKSNAGKPFFIVWSLVAVPTMTILISDMGDTVIASYKRGTFTLADWTVLPSEGIWRRFLDKHPWLLHWAENKAEKHAAEKRVAAGFKIGLDEEAPDADLAVTLEQLAVEEEPDQHELARRLALAIRRVANDLKSHAPRFYSYEEWVQYTRLIRFSSSKNAGEVEEEEEEEGLIEWDWIGEESPMLADLTESEWLLDRLTESLDRYMRRQMPEHNAARIKKRKSIDDRAEEAERRPSMGNVGMSEYSRRRSSGGMQLASMRVLWSKPNTWKGTRRQSIHSAKST